MANEEVGLYDQQETEPDQATETQTAPKRTRRAKKVPKITGVSTMQLNFKSQSS